MQVPVGANPGTHTLGDSGDLHFFNIRTVARHPSVYAATYFTAMLNPVKHFIEIHTRNLVDCAGKQERWQARVSEKKVQQPKNHRQKHMRDTVGRDKQSHFDVPLWDELSGQEVQTKSAVRGWHRPLWVKGVRPSHLTVSCRFALHHPVAGLHNIIQCLPSCA